MCDDYKKVCTLTLNNPGNIFFKKVKVCDRHIHMNVAVIIIRYVSRNEVYFAILVYLKKKKFNLNVL